MIGLEFGNNLMILGRRCDFSATVLRRAPPLDNRLHYLWILNTRVCVFSPRLSRRIGDSECRRGSLRNHRTYHRVEPNPCVKIQRVLVHSPSVTTTLNSPGM
jgi:hypothetical protein